MRMTRGALGSPACASASRLKPTRASIHAVVTQAFGRRDEADLVDALRTAGDLVVSLVAAEAGEICGHAALSRLRSPSERLPWLPLPSPHRRRATAPARPSYAKR